MKDKSIANVFCGPYNTFVITSKGEVYGMGLNSRGQLGIGNEIDQKMGPILIESLSVSNRRGR
jgi:alpha-tubulin suppressor-like RCC1 family protein